ncbi:MAG: hypothetical protein Q8Q31_00450 [Nanoarchaeota archaeon]|nr:hypothetical protein [Nanoarchaeota archaeon]
MNGNTLGEMLLAAEPFDIGQEVAIRRALNGKGNYYHGGTVKQVPLGSKGTIIELGGQSIKLLLARKPNIEAIPEKKTLWNTIRSYFGLKEIRAERPDNENYWTVHPDEIASKNPSIPRPKVEEANLENLLKGNVVETVNESGSTAFQPGFNVREEFVVWVREQFPDLEKYAGGRKSYSELDERREEVRLAAIKACQHGVKTTNSCVKGYFEDHLSYFRGSDGGRFYNNLCALTQLIEQVAVNIGRSSNWHYGTNLKRGRRKNNE